MTAVTTVNPDETNNLTDTAQAGAYRKPWMILGIEEEDGEEVENWAEGGL